MSATFLEVKFRHNSPSIAIFKKLHDTGYSFPFSYEEDDPLGIAGGGTGVVHDMGDDGDPRIITIKVMP